MKLSIEQAIDFAERKKQLGESVFDSQCRLTKLQEQRKLREMELMDDIANAVDSETGKPVYSNEAKRMTELTARTSVDPDLAVNSTYTDEEKKRLNHLQIEREHVGDMLKICLAFAAEQ